METGTCRPPARFGGKDVLQGLAPRAEGRSAGQPVCEGDMQRYKTLSVALRDAVDILGYPVRLLTWLMIVLPFSTPLFIRKIFAKIISSGRERKPKDLSEINYYNGAVIDLGEKNGIPTPINKKVVQRILIK